MVIGKNRARRFIKVREMDTSEILGGFGISNGLGEI